MALNLSDPGTIVAGYESIVDPKNKHNWLLLKYSSCDELFLCDHGTGGLSELKSKIHDLDRVFIAFYRQEIDVEPGFILINYIPPSISGVKRARALVHSRRIGTVFKKHQTTLTVDDVSKLTLDAIHQALDPELEVESPMSSVNSLSSQPMEPSSGQVQQSRRLNTPSRGHRSQPVESPPSSVGSPPRVVKPLRPQTAPTTSPLPQNQEINAQITISTCHVPALSPPTTTMNLPPLHVLNSGHDSLPIAPVRRAFSESDPPHPPSPPSPPPVAKSGSMFSNLIGRNKKKDPVTDSAPPPLPPKDYTTSPALRYRQLQQSPPQPHSDPYSSYPPPGRGNDSFPSEFRRRSRTGSLSEFHEQTYTEKANEEGANHNDVTQHVPLRGKWAPQRALDYEARMRQLQEERLQREEAERIAREEELRTAAERRWRKEQLEIEHAEEEARRRIALEEEMQRIAREKAMTEKREREEEERKRLEIEARRQVDRERRAEEHRKLEAWRKERKRLEEETTKRADEARRKEEIERRKKIQMAEAKVKRGRDVDTLVTGWVTIQNAESLNWKRRYFKFMGTAAYFYRSPQDTHEYLDKIELRGRFKAVREWNEGYEELESIPYSFAVEFNDGSRAWPMYADTEEEKYKILGLIHHAAGL